MSRKCFHRALLSRLALAALVSGLAAGSAVGQEVQVFGFESTTEGDAPPQQQATIAVGGPGGIAISSGATGGSMMFGGGAAFGVDPNNRSALFNLLANESVRKELQLKEDQYAGVQKIMQESQKRINDVVRTNMAAGNNNLGAGIRELMTESRKAAEVAIEEILLPEQLTRIRQLAYQVELAQFGLGDSLNTGRLGREIDVHDDQKQHLTDKAAAIETEARLAIAKIRAAARDKLFAELAPEQRKKAEELLGPHFEYEEPNFAKTMRQGMKLRQGAAPAGSTSRP